MQKSRDRHPVSVSAFLHYDQLFSMKTYKIKLVLILVLFLFLLITNHTKAQDKINILASPQSPAGTVAQEQINLYFFYGEGCPHCVKEEKFLSALKQKNQNITIYSYEVWHNRENAKLLSDIAKKLKLNISGVPLLLIGDKTISGYYNDETTGKEINNIINYYTLNKCPDVVGPIINSDNFQCEHGCKNNDGKECSHDCGCMSKNDGNAINKTKKISIPFFGEINTQSVSLPILTIMIAALDGFNPCAMWILLFLINLLIGMKNRKRMFTLGMGFIVASGAVYFLFLSAWLNLFLFLGFILWIRIAIGLIALLSGGYHLKEYWFNREAVCRITANKKRRVIFDKIGNIVKIKNFWLALGGIILLAVAVNLVELFCSAGLPAIYTQVLSIANLPIWKYYCYLVLYIFIFMLDDILIFVIAMSVLQIKTISSKYDRWSNLIGGIIMLLIGIFLLFKPEWLMFG